MICKPCGEAGDWNAKGKLPVNYHEKCKGHCDCQHKVGPTDKFIQTKAK